jgi:hypothetical protein
VTSIYISATPFARALIRAIEGSARNAFHDHPECGIINPEHTARSIAKRAAGTIAADWPRLSAVAHAATVAKPGGVVDAPEGNGGADFERPASRRTGCEARHGGGVRSARRPSPSALDAHKAVTALLVSAKRSGADPVRIEALKDALRIIRATIDGADWSVEVKATKQWK